MSSCSSSESTPKPTAYQGPPLPTTRPADSPMAERSAPILIVLATNSRATRMWTIGPGNPSLILAARPWPVTRPIRAATICTAAISGKVSAMVHSMFRPKAAPACE